MSIMTISVRICAQSGNPATRSDTLFCQTQYTKQGRMEKEDSVQDSTASIDIPQSKEEPVAAEPKAAPTRSEKKKQQEPRLPGIKEFLLKELDGYQS